MQDLHNQENYNPNIPPKMPEKELPVKRATRRSKRNNPGPVTEEPITRKTRSTRSRAKKLAATVEHAKVTFVDESEVQATNNKISPDKTSKNLSNPKTLKRTSSISPDSVKPVKKKSKSSDELTIDNTNLVIDDEDMSGKQTSTPVGTEPPQTLSLSSLVFEPQVKSTDKLVNISTDGENNQAKLAKKESLDNVTTNSEPPAETLVEIGNDDNAVKQNEVILVAESPPLSNAPPSATDKLVKPEKSILVKFNETVSPISNGTVAESPKIQKEFSGNIVNKAPDEIAKMVVDNDMSDETLDNDINNIPTTDENLILNTESTTEPMGTTYQICSENDTKTLRRSKRLSKQNTGEPVVELLPEQIKEKLQLTQLNKQASRKEIEPMSDSQDEAPAETVISESPKQIRRSTRLSKRVSKVSTGYSRRSSRRSSCRPGYFKKPLSLKQVEVQLDDVGPGINEFVKPELSGEKELGKKMLSNSEHSSTESEDDAPMMSSALPTNAVQQRYS